MSATPVGSNSATGTSVAIPTHQVGDVLVICAYRDGATVVPTKPAAGGTVPAWVDIDATAGANLNSLYAAYFVATATNHTSGIWTNATGVSVAVIRGADSLTPLGTHSQFGGASTTTATVNGIAALVADGSSCFLSFAGCRTVTAWSAPPAGYTQQSQVATEICCNTKDSTTADGSYNQSMTTSASGGYRTIQIEILALQMKSVKGGMVGQAVQRSFCR